MKKVYLCISTDVIQTGHINIINEAAKLGEVTVGVLCDECAAKYERYPLIPLEERMKIICRTERCISCCSSGRYIL